MESATPNPEISRQGLLEHLHALQGPRDPFQHPERLAAAQRYLVERFTADGLEVRLEEFLYVGREFPMQRSFANVTAKSSTAGTAPPLLIGAHFDSVAESPGADDNASGVAVLLEAARLAAAQFPTASVEFVGFNLEELSMIGSTHRAKAVKSRQLPFAGMLSLEMVGFTESEGLQRYPGILERFYPPVGNFIGLIANQQSLELLRRVEPAMRGVSGLPVEVLTVPGNGELIPDCRRSDHAPFWDSGLPAVLVTDTGFLRNPHYHKPSDTIDTLDLDFMERVCRGLVALIGQMAS